MAYSAALGAVYNHYLTTYAGKGSVSRYDTHKKSELRSIYNSIVKLNKDAPLYILDSSNESRAFAVGLKENARQLHNTIASLGGLEDEKLFSKKTAYSSNEDMVSASFIGEVLDDGEAPSFDIEVTSLASGQVNLGTFLPEDAEVSLAPGAYSFDLTINDLSYEFQYNIREGETNRQLQERLVRLVNNADIGVGAELLEDGKGNASLRLSSKSTGLKDGQDTIFQVSDDQTSKQTGTVDYLGIAFLSKLPCNASFLLNGEQRTASSNHFTVDKQFELTLNGIADAPGQKAQIGLKTDLDSLTENVGNLVSGYNSFLRAAAEYLDVHPKSSKLLSEMEGMASRHKTDLEDLGFSFESGGQLSLNADRFRNTVLNDENSGELYSIRDFTNSILRKVDEISLNPMEYIDKTLVAYKNPGHNFVSPYVTSNYSGMLFNSYC